MKIKNLSRKSQAEVMGILIVVVLVSLGMLLVARFIMTRNSSQEKQEFTQQQAAANSLTSILKITTGCKDLSVTELYQDCAHNWPGGSIKCGTKKSCEYVQAVVATAINEAFKEENLNMYYYYTVKRGGEDEIVLPIKHTLYNQKCRGNVISKKNPIPLTPGYLDVELSLC